MSREQLVCELKGVGICQIVRARVAHEVLWVGETVVLQCGVKR